MNLPTSGSRSSFASSRHEYHGGGNFAAVGAFVKFLEVRIGDGFQRRGAHFPLRHVPAELLAARLHVLNLCAVVGRPIERRLVQFIVRNWNSEARAKHLQLVFVQLFLLVSDVLAFTRFAEPVALNRLGENDGRRPGVIECRAVSCVHFNWIVPAQSHARELIVGEMLDHFQQARVATEEVLPEVRAAFNEIFLVLAVADFTEPLDQQAVAVVLNQVVPIRSPDDFDYVPAGAAEDRFQFLDDLSVSAYRTVQPLKVAVDDEDQIVELFARCQRDRAE